MSLGITKRSTNMLMVSAILTGLPAIAIADDHGPDLNQSTVLSDLKNPWDLAFLNNGTMFFTEKCHGLSVRMPDGDVSKLMGMKDAEGYASNESDLFCHGQAGMNGVAVDPNFDDNRYLYVYSASSMTPPATNRVIRLTVNDDFTSVSDRTDIVDDIPYKPEATDHPFGDAGAHNGGRLQFNPDDGFLYVTTGDNHNGELPQSPQSLGGKVLRIDRNGEAAAGNDTGEGFDSRIFTYGHRNVQGLTFHPDSSQPIVTEHGPWHSDEVNALMAGGNSGWDPRPNMAGRDNCPDDYCGYEPNQKEGMDPEERAAYMPLTDLETYPEAIKPAWQNNNLSQGISGTDFLAGEQWGAWDGRLVVGFMGIGFGDTPIGNRIEMLDLADDGLSVRDTGEMILPNGSTRIRTLVQGPDGDLYAIVDDTEIHRISPE